LEYPPLKVTAKITPQSSCITPDGAINLTVNGGSEGKYNFLWSNGKSTKNITGLTAGTYTVIVSDTCKGVAPVTVEFAVSSIIPPLSITAPIIVNPTCADPSSGSITLGTVSGGSGNGNYSYAWSTGSTADSITNLVPGTYTVTVSDNYGCVAPLLLEYIITTLEYPPLKVTANIFPQSSCIDPDGEIRLTVSGGSSGAYNFLWSNGDNAEGIAGLTAGTYTVIVSDTCKGVAPVTVELVVPSIIAPLSITAPIIVNPSCDNPSSGSITLGSVSGGSGYYSYAWSTGETTTGVADLIAGTYTVTVSDDYGCVAPLKLLYTLRDTLYTPLKVAETHIDPTCANNDGTISVTVEGGTGMYTYEWSNGATTATAGNTLAAGSYTVTVKDAACKAVAPVVLTVTLAKDLNLLEIKLDEKINPTCPGGNDGKIRVSVIGGNIGSYTYTWTATSGSGLVTTAEDQETLTAGIYNLKVSASGDGNSCSATLNNIELKDPFDWTSASLNQYITLIGKNLQYKNGEQVQPIRLLTNSLPDGAFISWTTDNTTTGIAAGGDAEIPGFTAYNPNVGGVNQSVITVKVYNPLCLSNFITGTFTITIGSKTIDDLDLVAEAVAGMGQVKCAETAFDDITFSARRTDGAALGEVSYLVEFVYGNEVLKNAKLGEIPTTANGLWNISAIPVTDRVSGKGTYRVTPRSNNGQGVPVTFTLEVLPEPQVDSIPNYVVCNGSPFYVSFTGKNANTLFDWTADAAARSLGIPVSGSQKIDMAALNNTGTSSVVGTITVTPRLSDCPGTVSSVRTFTVTVLPTPKVKNIQNIVVENGVASPAIPFDGTDTYGVASNATSYRWVTDNPAIDAAGALSIIGSGEGMEYPSFIVENTTANPAQAKVTVIPVIEDLATGYICEGTPVEFYILVASKPAINAIHGQTACEGNMTNAIVADGLPAGNGYYITWTGGASIGLADFISVDPSPRKRSIDGFTATKVHPFTPTVAIVKVTPHLYFGGHDFPGDEITFTYTVNPNTTLAAEYREDRQTHHEYCSGESVTMNVEAETGVDITYQWYKDEFAIPGATGDAYTIAAANVSHTTSGRYYAIVSGACKSVKSKTYDVLVKANILTQRWNDVLTVDCMPETNGGFVFSDFQWYRQDANGGSDELLVGETKSYLYISGGLSAADTYYVIAKTQNGIDYKSCPAVIQVMPEETVTVYPNPVKTGETVTVAVPNNATIHVIDYSGVILKTVKAGGTVNVTMPNKAGVYILRIILQGQPAKEFKVIVK
jgi:hypothetical protein